MPEASKALQVHLSGGKSTREEIFCMYREVSPFIGLHGHRQSCLLELFLNTTTLVFVVVGVVVTFAVHVLDCHEKSEVSPGCFAVAV